MRAALLAGIIALALSGCISTPGHNQDSANGTDANATTPPPLIPIRWPPTTPVPGVFDVLVVDVKLVREGGDYLWANVGPHCGNAFVYEEYVALEENVYKALNGSQALLVVNGSVEGNWHTFGHEPYGLGLPATVRVRAGEADVPVGNITWNATSTRASIDGMQVSLPYAWTLGATDGAWRLEASLHLMTMNIEVWERTGGCR